MAQEKESKIKLNAELPHADGFKNEQEAQKFLMDLKNSQP